MAAVFRCHVLSCLVSSVAMATYAQENTVTIGHVGPLSGAQASYGKDTENGVQMAIDELNQRGITIGGRRIRFQMISIDDGSTPTQSSAAARSLCNLKVNGTVNSSISIAAAKIYADCGIPNITGSATNPHQTRAEQVTSFRMVANDKAQSAAVAQYIADAMKLQKVAVIADSTAYSQGVASHFKSAAQAKGIQVVGEASINDEATELVGPLGNFQSSRPDIIFFAGSATQAVALLRQLGPAGMSNMKLIAGGGVCGTELQRGAANTSNLENLICVESGAVLPDIFGVETGRNRYESAFPNQLQARSTYTYDATKSLVAAMKRANSVDPKDYLPCLRELNLEGLTGNTSFKSNGDVRSPLSTVYAFRNGKKTIVSSVAPEPRIENPSAGGCVAIGNANPVVAAGQGAGSGPGRFSPPRSLGGLPPGAQQQTIPGYNAAQAVDVVAATPGPSGKMPDRVDLPTSPGPQREQEGCDKLLAEAWEKFNLWRRAADDPTIKALDVDTFWPWFKKSAQDEPTKSVAEVIRASMLSCYRNTPPDGFPEDIVNRIGAIARTPGVRDCSGLRVSTNSVLTARHCVEVQDGASFRRVTPTELLSYRFYLPSFANGVVITSITKAGSVGYRVEDDWVLLSTAPLPEMPSDALPTVTPSDIQPGTPMAIGGYVSPLDSGGAFAAHFSSGTSCRALYATNECLTHTCNTVPGLSGAPLFALVNSKWSLVGIHSRSFSATEWHTNSCQHPAKVGLSSGQINGGPYVRSEMR